MSFLPPLSTSAFFTYHLLLTSFLSLTIIEIDPREYTEKAGCENEHGIPCLERPSLSFAIFETDARKQIIKARWENEFSGEIFREEKCWKMRMTKEKKEKEMAVRKKKDKEYRR